MQAILNFLQKPFKSKKIWMSPEEKFLSQAVDLADLERRVKQLKQPTDPYRNMRYWI